VDALRGSTDFPECLTDNKTLQLDVRKLYKSKYFDPYQGDAMPKDLALEMFDTAVNMGVGRAVTFLQKALNVLNRNQLLYPDMVEDGDYGPTTHKALQVLLNENGTEVLVKMLNVLQGMHYIEYMNKSPKQEKYARGWFSRVQIGK
jgi:lysozyme family protein